MKTLVQQRGRDSDYGVAGSAGEGAASSVEVAHIDFPIHWDSLRYQVTNRIRRAPSDRLPVSLAPVFLGCNRVVVRRDAAYPPHQHTDHELIIVERGPYRCRLNRRQIEVTAGNCLLLKPGDHHEVDCRQGQSHYVLHFRLGLRERERPAGISIFAPQATAEQQIIAVLVNDLKPVLTALQKAESRGTARRFSAELQDCLVEQVIWLLLSAVSPVALSGAFSRVSRERDWVEQFQAAVASVPLPTLSVDRVAATMQIGRSSLRQRCRELLGEPPAAYLMRYKVAVAAELLRSPRPSIKETSFAAGFQNPHHFARVFKRCTGQTPTEFRRAGAGVARGP